MCRLLMFSSLLILLLPLAACDKVDQTIDAVDKVRTIKSDMEKKVGEAKKHIDSAADRMLNGKDEDKSTPEAVEKDSGKGGQEPKGL